MRNDYTRLPFVCPVPVREVPMVPLHPEHAELAVRTDLAALGGHGRTDHDPADLLYADFQLAAWSNSFRRLGAGRAGFYRGHYLKGVGRTPLAANWNDERDWYHASGHLFPSAAVREYLTTVYLQARGLSRRLVPCTGLLLSKLEPTLEEQLAKAFGNAVQQIPPIDRALQAITVKPAGFARASNFLWLASRLSGWGEQWRVFVPLMQRYCELGQVLPGPDEACTASSLAAGLAAAARRSLQGLADDFRAGVHWNSLWNNVTLDGRVLDLEVATLVCRPFLGATTSFGFGTSASSAEQTTPRRLHGLEAIDHALELRSTIARLRGEVANLLSLPLSFDAAEQRFMEELVEELSRLSADEALFGADALCTPAADALAELGVVDRSVLVAEIRAYAAERARAWAEPRLSQVVLERTPLEFRIEPAVRQALWLVPGGYRESEWEEARFIAHHLAAIEACTDIERALAAVSEAAAAIRARWAAPTLGAVSRP